MPMAPMLRGISTRDLIAFQQALDNAVCVMRQRPMPSSWLRHVQQVMGTPPEPPALPTADPKAAARLRFTGWRDYYHFTVRLERLGFRRLGFGMYSSVFTHPRSDKIVKIGSKMDGWVEYITWAGRMGYLGTFAPMVHSLHIIKDGSGRPFYVAVMERLDVTVNRAKYLSRYEGGRGYDRAIQEHASLIVLERELRTAPQIERKAPQWAQFCANFRRDFRGAHWDMHDENWMVRFDGSLVLTDPIACEHPTELWRRGHKTPARVRSTDWAKLCPQAPQPAFKHAQEAM